jgi:MoaA/NifB/PqqE/SkfB family radical SAM enzyme
VSAGPKLSDLMEEVDACSYIDQAAEIDHGVSGLCFSGGEVFLYYDLLKRLLQYARSRFAHTSIITNAFWATSKDRAYERLSALKDAGLNTLVVSTSPFHSRYVDPARVRIALATGEKIGLQTFVKATTPNNGPSIGALLEALGPIPDTTEVDEMTFLPGGRGATLPLASFAVKQGIPNGRCPGAILTIHPNGDVYFCCTPGSKTDALKLGNARTTPIRELVRDFYFCGLFAFLREVGPAGFVPEIESAGLRRYIKEGYVDVCHLCTSLVSNPATLRVVRQVAKRYEAELFVTLASKAIESLNKGAM